MNASCSVAAFARIPAAAERSLAEEQAAADRSDEIQRRAAAARLGAHDEFGRESWLNELAGETLKALAMLFSHRL